MKKKKQLTKKDMRKLADSILDKEMYTQKGYHQYVRSKDLTAYTLVYGMDIDFITSRGFLGFGRKTEKRVLLSKPIRAGIHDIWVYFPPSRKIPSTNIRSVPRNEEEDSPRESSYAENWEDDNE
jgi:hypothetical protein